ncbi:hypothetical protein [Deinococcus koreensis]|nr:hypothetical protein [Deinococcus koreensis]
MTHDAVRQGQGPLRHRCFMTSGRCGFISYFDFSDVLVIGGTFYLSTMLAAKLFVSPPPKLLLTLGMVALAWTLNFTVKKRLLPSPGIVEHAVNWWFGGIDAYEPDVDHHPVPLLVTRELQVGTAVTTAARALKPGRPVRRKRGVHPSAHAREQ